MDHFDNVRLSSTKKASEGTRLNYNFCRGWGRKAALAWLPGYPFPTTFLADERQAGSHTPKKAPLFNSPF